MADLAARLRRGDTDALGELYDRNARRAFGLAYRVLGDGTSAEDVVHEAFLEIWRIAPRIDPNRGNVESLLMTVVHRRSLDAVRARARRAEVSDVPDVIDERAADAVEAAGLASDHQRVRRAMASLSAEHREALELAYLGELSHREIAERVGIPIGTVKSRIHHAMRQLRETLGFGRAVPRAVRGASIDDEDGGAR